ncbi:MAG TPA: hypothetical protein VKG85_00680 [Actinomycetes bacterium]|nr:hypothetical protein [Actinomycetes bacterium]
MLTHRTWPGIVALPVTVVAVLLIASCGSVGPDSDGAASSAPGDGSPGPPSPPSPGESTPTPTEQPTTEQPTTGEPTDSTVTVRGTVVAGVEAGCLLVGDYLLVVSDPADQQVLQPGASVEVTGRPKPTMMTICQQGTPLIVSSARSL